MRIPPPVTVSLDTYTTLHYSRLNRQNNPKEGGQQLPFPGAYFTPHSTFAILLFRLPHSMFCMHTANFNYKIFQEVKIENTLNHLFTATQKETAWPKPGTAAVRIHIAECPPQ